MDLTVEVLDMTWDHLASGGAADIYVCPDRRLALKRAKLEVPEALDSLVTEVALASSLRHPSVVPVHVVIPSNENDLPGGYIMPFFGDSEDGIVSHRPLHSLSLEDKLRVYEGVAAALEHAHEQGIVHGDVKPDNIFYLFDSNGNAHGVLGDWGIAISHKHKLEQDDPLHTHFGEINKERRERAIYGGLSGSVDYLSPEVVRDPELSLESSRDVYALAASLFENITGKIYQRLGENPVSQVVGVYRMSNTKRDQKLRPLDHVFRSEYGPTFLQTYTYQDFKSAITKALDVDPKNRSTVHEFGSALIKFRSGLGIAEVTKDIDINHIHSVDPFTIDANAETVRMDKINDTVLIGYSFNELLRS